MVDEDPWALLDQHLPRALRAELEESLWRPIEARATLEVLREDPSFFEDPGRHPAMFADHGVVHVRDVAAGLVRLVEVVDGVLLPARPLTRTSLIQTWGVALTYLHDVGMVDMSRTRAVRPRARRPRPRRRHPSRTRPLRARRARPAVGFVGGRGGRAAG